ncbi:3-hydroxyanthranilic acid dioxygenase [Coemansia erecta]|uniref:3-hydroxyanthranilate 3,4-dioxygenase n=1 Tax=Coemansia erecta TaxID=147472 RepID=A0A9W7XXA8_9FUNG|nr:3-hydroxyanthranilic acid dioxygenase [Coemansia erecta]
MLPTPFNLPQWLATNAHELAPPVCNRVIQSGSDYLVMIVGGPNARTDFHINPTEEWFHQVRGRMLLRMFDEQTGQIRDQYVEEGEMLLLPAHTPHSPVRFADTVGVVVERRRGEGVEEALRWYCEGCGKVVHERWFVCRSLEKDLKPVIEEYCGCERLRTCGACGHVNPTTYTP